MIHDVEIINVDYEDWPRCSKCDTLVEDFFVLKVFTDTEIIAKCHNQLERVVISFDLCKNANLSDITIGSAFQNNKQE